MNIGSEVEQFKKYVSSMTQDEVENHHIQQQRAYDTEYSKFIKEYEKSNCYMCGKPFSTISKENPCLHWLLRKCKFKKKDFSKISEKFNFYQISAYLRWVSYAETKHRNINNLKAESSDRKKFEVTIKWKNIEWTLDCSNNDFLGHAGSKTDFPHWHFQMRIDGRQFINFNDCHIRFSDSDLLNLNLEGDPESGFEHNFGYRGQGMQELMDNISTDLDGYLSNASSTSDPEEGVISVQSMIMAPNGGISEEKINEALQMHRETRKTLRQCFSQVLEMDQDISIKSIVSPSDNVPQIAKRTERERR